MNGTRRFLAHARRALWRQWSEAILIRDLDAPYPNVPPRLAVTIASITADNVEAIATDGIQDFVDTATLRDRLRRGHRWFIARSGDRIISGTWVGFETWDLEDIGVRIPLDRAEAFIYDAYTLPAHRGRRVFPAVLGACITFVREHGYRRAFARVSHRNYPSLRAFEAAGFQRGIELLSIRVLDRVAVHLANAATASGSLLDTLVLRSARMTPGVLVWRGRERSGIRVNRAIMDRSFTEP